MVILLDFLVSQYYERVKIKGNFEEMWTTLKYTPILGMHFEDHEDDILSDHALSVRSDFFLWKDARKTKYLQA